MRLYKGILVLMVLVFLGIPVVSASYTNVTHGFSFNDTWTVNENTYTGMKILAVRDMVLKTLFKNASTDQATRAYLLNKSGIVLGQANYTANKANFNDRIILRAGQQYYFVSNAAGTGGTWTSTRRSFTLDIYNISTDNLIWIQGVDNAGADVSNSVQNILNVTVDADNPIFTTINSPTNNSLAGPSSIVFNVTAEVGNLNLTNATIYIWNSTGSLINITTRTLSGIANNSIINVSFNTIGKVKANILVCGNNQSNTNCSLASESNLSLDYGLVVNSETYSTSTTELNTESFSINVTFGSSVIASSGRLYYNNTYYNGLSSVIGGNTIFTTSVSIPGVSAQTNKSFFWTIDVSTTSSTAQFNTTTHNQTVNDIALTNCTTGTLILNYTLFDEETQTKLSSNTTIETQVILSGIGGSTNTTFGFNSTTNPQQICITTGVLNGTNYRLDTVTRYQATDHVSEFHHIQNYTLNNNTIPQNINLYDLRSSVANNFIIYFKGDDLQPVEGAILILSRKYISEATYKTVEIPKTDKDGKVTVHVTLDDAIYNLQYVKEGELLASFNDVVFSCQNPSLQTCQLTLNPSVSGISPTNFVSDNDLSYVFTTNVTTRTVSVIFSSLSGASYLISLNGTFLTNNTQICSQQVTSSSGTLNCVVSESYGNTTMLFTLYKTGSNIASRVTNFLNSPTQGRGFGVLLAIVLYCTCVFFFSEDPKIMLIGGVLGLIVAGALNLYVGGSVIGYGSTLLWFIVSVVIVLVRMDKRT